MPTYGSAITPSTAANPIESNLKIKRLAQLTEVVEKHIDKVASGEIENARERKIALIEQNKSAADMAMIKGDVEALKGDVAVMKKTIGILKTEAAKLKAKVTNMDELLGEAALEDRRRKNKELEQDVVLFKSYIAKQRAIDEEDDEDVGRKRKADELEDPDVQEKRQKQ